MKHRAFLGLGSRDGERASMITEALLLLAQREVGIERVSGLYETAPVDLPGSRPLLNAVAEVATTKDPEQLLMSCLEVETLLGRRRAPERPDRGPRPIDLDILFFDDLVTGGPGLIIPHPRLHLRKFVLIPLAEIAPHLRHPVLGLEVATLLAACDDTSWVRPYRVETLR